MFDDAVLQDGDRIMVLDTCGRAGLNAATQTTAGQGCSTSALLPTCSEVDYVPRFVGDAPGVPGQFVS